MASYMQPRANLGGVSRQPFRPGQWQGFKGVSRNTTYIQNNFYGSSIFGANRNYGYADTCCNQYQTDGNSDMPKWMKWMTGIGMGTQLLGGILGLFSKKEPKEAGGAAEPTTTGTPTGGAATTPAPPTTTTPAPVSEPTPAPVSPTTQAPVDDGGGKDDYSGLSSLNSMVCRDASGKTQNISGSFAIKEAGANGEPPKSITITDNSSGTAHQYTYELTGKSSDGKPIYTCKSMNGQASSTANAYTLEMKGSSGKPELVQYKEQANHGAGLRFGTTATATNAGSEINETPSTTPVITSATVTQPAEPEEPASTNEQPADAYTDADKSKARAMGQSVADDLVGYTSTAEKKEVLNIINNSLNENNIADFLNGYKNNKGLGDDLMKQINTEYGWSNKEKLDAQKNIVENIIKKAESEGVSIPKSNMDYLNKFLETGENAKISDNAAKNLDSIINNILQQLKAKHAPGSYGGGTGGGGGAGSSF